MRVVLIDDASAIRFALGRLLVSLGHAVVGEAASLEAGLVLARDLAPGAIVVDGRLLADVVVAVDRLRHAAPGARLVAIGARDETKLLRDALAAGMTGAIRRPILRSSVAAAFAERTTAPDPAPRMLRPEGPRNGSHG